MKKIAYLALMVCFLGCATAHADSQTEYAQRNENMASYYASLPEASRLSFAMGVSVGMGAVYDFTKSGKTPPNYDQLISLYDFCYVYKNGIHVHPRVIAIVASLNYSIPETHRILLEFEAENTPVKKQKK